MKVKVKIKKKENQSVFVHTEYITLDSALKVAGIAGTGGQAKILIKSDEIKVNGEICNVVRKKLYVGDCFSFEGKLFEIKNEGTV
ncbi:MAG: RNA-binding S4 domain-containing protein [Clostridia bacterium]|nr:RNA-binding S4 domain-containing protein [Clostridia bacterium]